MGKEERFQINNLSMNFKKLGKSEQTKHSISSRK
jgi:hypothetical protein